MYFHQFPSGLISFLGRNTWFIVLQRLQSSEMFFGNGNVGKSRLDFLKGIVGDLSKCLLLERIFPLELFRRLCDRTTKSVRTLGRHLLSVSTLERQERACVFYFWCIMCEITEVDADVSCSSGCWRSTLERCASVFLTCGLDVYCCRKQPQTQRNEQKAWKKNEGCCDNLCFF